MTGPQDRSEASSDCLAVREAHRCFGSSVAQHPEPIEEIVCAVMLDPEGCFLALTLFEKSVPDDGDLTKDFLIRFGMGIKDSGQVDP